MLGLPVSTEFIHLFDWLSLSTAQQPDIVQHLFGVQVVADDLPIHADGKDMAEMSELLSEAIDSIIDVKEESDIDSLFFAGGTTALLSQVSGLDDFELICFLVVK